MTTLLMPELTDREFGASVLNASDFRKWIESKRLSVPTVPPISDDEFLHVETLLVAIEGGATEGMTKAEAAEIVRNTPSLAADPAAKHSAKWLLGAEAHKQWRAKIAEAVKKGELILLDLGSKLPIEVERDDKPLVQSERTTLLVIIASLLHEMKLPASKTSKTAAQIADMTQRIGTPIGQRTIEEHLKRIPDALERRASS